MKVKLQIQSDIIFFIYFLGVAFLQIAEVFVDFSITKLFFLIFVFALVLETFKKVSKRKLLYILIYELICILYFAVYTSGITINESTARTALIVFMVFPFFSEGISFQSFKLWDFIDNLLFVYLILNFFLYFSKNSIFFQWDSGWRYVGGSDNPNLLATLMFTIVIIEFWGKSIKSYIIQVMAVIMTLLVSSRTYSFLAVIVFFLSILFNAKNKRKMLKRMLLAFSVGGIITLFFLNYLYKDTDLLNRYIIKGLQGNGRTFLVESAINACRQANFLDILSGVGLGNIYKKISSATLYHSFAENSYLTVLLLFGFFGIAVILMYIFTVLRYNKMIIYKILFFSVLLSYMFQDTVTYIQGFYAINGALMIAATDSRYLINQVDKK